MSALLQEDWETEWQRLCKSTAVQVNRGCGLVWELFQERFSAVIEGQLAGISAENVARAIEIARDHGYESREELDQLFEDLRDAGYCSHALDPQCCPLGCGDKTVPRFVAEFDPVRFIIQVGSAILSAQVEIAIDQNDHSERAVKHFGKACELVETIAYHNALGATNWDPDCFLSVYCELRGVYSDAYYEALQTY